GGVGVRAAGGRTGARGPGARPQAAGEGGRRCAPRHMRVTARRRRRGALLRCDETWGSPFTRCPDGTLSVNRILAQLRRPREGTRALTGAPVDEPLVGAVRSHGICCARATRFV